MEHDVTRVDVTKEEALDVCSKLRGMLNSGYTIEAALMDVGTSEDLAVLESLMGVAEELRARKFGFSIA